MFACSMCAIGSMTFIDDTVDAYTYQTHTLYALVTHFSGICSRHTLVIPYICHTLYPIYVIPLSYPIYALVTHLSYPICSRHTLVWFECFTLNPPTPIPSTLHPPR